MPKPIDAITTEDLSQLVAYGVSESRRLDYKLTLPGGTDDDKAAFGPDLSAFANTDGGDLIFGVQEEAGAAVAIPGVVG